MSLIAQMRKVATEFHQKHGVASPNVDYIDDDYILRALGSKERSALEKAERQVSNDAEEYQGVKTAGELTQWSGYISQVYYQDDNMYFVTPCQAPQSYVVNKTQVVSLAQNGICGNYTQYYAVINYA